MKYHILTSLAIFLILFLFFMYTIKSFIFNCDKRPILGVESTGGLGNLLFQFAFIYALSRNNNCKYTIIGLENYKNPHTDTNLEFLKNNIMKDSNFIKECRLDSPKKVIEPRQFTFHDFQPLIDRDNDTIFSGYFQSEKYFKKYRCDILEILKEPNYITRKLNSLNIDFNAVFLHVRLNDYVGLDWHLPIDYYIKCLQLLPDYIPKIYVFSDNIDKARYIISTLDTKDKVVEYIENLNEIETLYAMSRMKYGGICANSSFSWWGTWLNTSPYKQVYMPKPWIKGDSHDVYPENAIIVEV